MFFAALLYIKLELVDIFIIRVKVYLLSSPSLSCFLVHSGGEEGMDRGGAIEESFLSECLRTSCIFSREADLSQHTLPFVLSIL